MDDVYHSMDGGGLVGLVALDLRKAFDTVNHSILINKLSHYGINDTNISWFKSYLKPRFLMSGTLIFGNKTNKSSSTHSKLCTC